MTKKEFNDTIAVKCNDKDDWKCKKTGAACKDYMCPQLKSSVKEIVKVYSKSKTKEEANKKKCTNNNPNRFNKIKW